VQLAVVDATPGHESHFVVEALADRLIAATKLEPVRAVVEARLRVPVRALFFESYFRRKGLCPGEVDIELLEEAKVGVCTNQAIEMGSAHLFVEKHHTDIRGRQHIATQAQRGEVG
jgi:hypothetical protein